MIVYAIKNRTNGKVYVGQTTQTLRRRFQSHIDNARRTHRGAVSAIGSALLKYGRENFVVEELQRCTSQEELNEAEAWWIAALDCLAPNGYNIRPGGSQKGRMLPSTKAKLRGRVVSAETRAKMSAAARRRTLSAAQRAVLQFGRDSRWERGRRLAAAGEGNSNSRLTSAQVDSIRSLYASEGHTQSELSAMFGIHQTTVSAVVNGRIWPDRTRPGERQATVDGHR